MIIAAWCQPFALHTLPLLQCESILVRITVIIKWPSTCTTATVTRLTFLALFIHKKTFHTVIHALSICCHTDILKCFLYILPNVMKEIIDISFIWPKRPTCDLELLISWYLIIYFIIYYLYRVCIIYSLMKNGLNITKDVESLFTPVALRLVTDYTLFDFTRGTHHGIIRIIGSIWTGLMTVCAVSDKHRHVVSIWGDVKWGLIVRNPQPKRLTGSNHLHICGK